MRERRKDVRVPKRLEVRWNGFSSCMPAVTADISLGGCYVESLHPVNTGDLLCFDFARAANQSLRLHGQVLYRHPNIGFGVRFTDSNAGERILDLLRPSAQESEALDIRSLVRPCDMPLYYCN
jgi:hypothetical protein